MKDAFQGAGIGPIKQDLFCSRFSYTRMARDRQFGLWVAEKLGKDSGSAEAYAADIASENFDNSGDIHMLYRVRADLISAGIRIAMPELLAQLSKAEAAARQGAFQPN